MRKYLVPLVVVLAFAGACGNGGSGSGGRGGGSAVGGASAQGAPGTGGAAGARFFVDAGGGGGSPGTGGAVSTGGGGSPGTGGAVSTGGAAGSPRDAGGTGGAPNDAGGADTAGGSGGRTDAGGGPDATVDGGAVYAPCPTNGSPCIVMPLGDSITDGFPYENGAYRVELFHQSVQNGTPITFVGRNANGPATVDNMTFPRGHEGYSGFTIDTDSTHSGISPRVDAAIAMFHPHIVLLHIGTNDVNGNVNVANAPTRLGALIDQLTTDAPNALVVVAQIIPTTTDATNTRVSAYNAAVPGLVQQRAAAGKHVVRLDMYTAFTTHADYKTALMFDNLHPNTTGYATMGDAWYGAIQAVLPKH